MRVFLGCGCVLFVVCALVPLGAAPEDSPAEGLVLSLEDAVERAVEHSIALQQDRLSLEEEEYSSRRLWAEIFPSISASAGISARSIPLFAGGGRRVGAGNFGYSLSAGLRLGLNAGIPYRMRLLGLAYRQRLLTYEEARRLLEIDTAQDFYTLIMDGEYLVQLGETLSLAEKQLDKHLVGRANGTISEAVLLQSRLAVETARYELSRARSDYSVKLGVFLAALGLSPETPVRLEGEFTIRKLETEAEELIRDYLPRRPDIQAKRQEIEELELTERQTAMSKRAPSLDLAFNWGGGPAGTNGPINGGFSDNIGGSATLTIPIDPWIPGTKESQALRRARTAVGAARLDLRRIEETAAAEIRSLAVNLQNSWENLEIARLREEMARRSYEYSEQGFLGGFVEALILENSRNDLAEARYQLLLGESNYRKYVLDLARAVNADWRRFMRDAP
jgi:outer membrane protein TolC